MKFPEELLYTKSHEWVKTIGGKEVLIGLTDYAQHELGDLVFVNLPEKGRLYRLERPVLMWNQ